MYKKKGEITVIIIIVWNDYTSPLETLPIIMIWYLPQWVKQTYVKEKHMQTLYKWKSSLTRPSSSTVKLHLFF